VGPAGLRDGQGPRTVPKPDLPRRRYHTPPDKPGDDVTVIDLKIFDHTGTALEMATRRAQEE
jgi:hypothetical protein